MPELPDPRTEEALRSLMRDVRYRNSFHPENASYRGAVTEGFRKLYPDSRSRTPPAG